MRTLRELKKVFIGEIIAILGFLPYVMIINDDLGRGIDYILDYYIFDDDMLILLMYCGAALVVTYIGYTLYQAIKRDVTEIQMYFKNKKLENK